MTRTVSFNMLLKSMNDWVEQSLTIIILLFLKFVNKKREPQNDAMSCEVGFTLCLITCIIVLVAISTLSLAHDLFIYISLLLSHTIPWQCSLTPWHNINGFSIFSLETWAPPSRTLETISDEAYMNCWYWKNTNPVKTWCDLHGVAAA
jgi:hypothetical protein